MAEGQRSARLTSCTSAESIDPSYKPKVLKRSGQSIDSNEFDLYNQAKILVLYSGGTIGMKSHGGGKFPTLEARSLSLHVLLPLANGVAKVMFWVLSVYPQRHVTIQDPGPALPAVQGPTPHPYLYRAPSLTPSSVQGPATSTFKLVQIGPHCATPPPHPGGYLTLSISYSPPWIPYLYPLATLPPGYPTLWIPYTPRIPCPRYPTPRYLTPWYPTSGYPTPLYILSSWKGQGTRDPTPQKGSGTRDTLTPVDRGLTNICENITFPQLRWRSVEIGCHRRLVNTNTKRTILWVYCLILTFSFAVYSPEPNFLVPELKKLPMFHDPSFTLSPDHTEHPLVMP